MVLFSNWNSFFFSLFLHTTSIISISDVFQLLIVLDALHLIFFFFFFSFFLFWLCGCDDDGRMYLTEELLVGFACGEG